MTRLVTSRHYARKLCCFLLLVLVVIASAQAMLAHATTGNNASAAINWSTPNAMALRQVSQTMGSQNQPNFLNNTDCQLVTYRTASSADMQTGCFTPTAFGLMDTDGSVVIFNGSDEGLSLSSAVGSFGLVPWPKAGVLLTLATAGSGGSYINMYRDPTAVMQDQRNLLGQLSGKQLTAAPDLQLTDRLGQPLLVHPESLAFADTGSWMVVETQTSGFIRINLATLDMTTFAPLLANMAAVDLPDVHVAVSDDGHFVAIQNTQAAYFRVFDLASCSGTVVNLQPLHCQSYNYDAFIKSQLPDVQTITHVRFVNDGLLSFEALSPHNDAENGVYELTPRAEITSLINYLGLGDSYTSGEGAFDYLDGTDNDTGMCHLSARSYPLLLANDVFGGSNGGHSVACSGATINDVGSTSDSYRGQNRGSLTWPELQTQQPALLSSILTNFLPGYVAQQHFVKQYQPGVITVSVGGDDVGFGDIIERCVAPQLSQHFSDSICFDTYEDRQELKHLIDKTSSRLSRLYQQLLQQAPGSRLYAIGYPQIAVDTGSCAANVHLSRSELEFSEEMIDYINEATSKAALAGGANYIDISQALKGHRLCETASYNVAVNGLTAGKDAGLFGVKVLGKESYHPNALGQALIETAILQQSHNFAIAVHDVPVKSGVGSLDNAPKSARTINQLTTSVTAAHQVVKPGRLIQIALDSLQQGLLPNVAYTVRLDGPNGALLGSTKTNTVSQISLPANIGPGEHTIDIIGVGQDGQSVDVRQPITVVDPAATPNSCPVVGGSGQDVDHDGTDDACDAYIGPPDQHSSVGAAGSSTLDDSVPEIGSFDSNSKGEISNNVSATAKNTDSNTAIRLKASQSLQRQGSTDHNQLGGRSSASLADKVGWPNILRKKLFIIVWLPILVCLIFLAILAYLLQQWRVRQRRHFGDLRVQ